VCLLAYSGGENALIIRVAWRVSYKMQELLPLHVHQGSPTVSGGIRVAHFFSLLYCIVCFVFLRPVSHVCQMLPVSLDCPFLIVLSIFSNIVAN
jgi:hypothetical protein